MKQNSNKAIPNGYLNLVWLIKKKKKYVIENGNIYF